MDEVAPALRRRRFVRTRPVEDHVRGVGVLADLRGAVGCAYRSQDTEDIRRPAAVGGTGNP
jgi:hypothetical protein